MSTHYAITSRNQLSGDIARTAGTANRRFDSWLKRLRAMPENDATLGLKVPCHCLGTILFNDSRDGGLQTRDRLNTEVRRVRQAIMVERQNSLTLVLCFVNVSKGGERRLVGNIIFLVFPQTFTAAGGKAALVRCHVGGAFPGVPDDLQIERSQTSAVR